MLFKAANAPFLEAEADEATFCMPRRKATVGCCCLRAAANLYVDVVSETLRSASEMADAVSEAENRSVRLAKEPGSRLLLRKELQLEATEMQMRVTQVT